MSGGIWMNPIRPTSGKLLQTLFNIVGPRPGGSFLDLFAGTGRVGLEALRWGFTSVVAVELNPRACSGLKTSFLRKPEGIFLEIVCMDVRRAMVLLCRKERVFDMVFADPPYENDWVFSLTKGDSFLWRDLLSEDGVFVLEHSVREKVPEELTGIVCETRRYGDSCLSFLRPPKRGECR